MRVEFGYVLLILFSMPDKREAQLAPSMNPRPYYGSPQNMKSTMGCVSMDGKFVRRYTADEQREMEVNKREMEEYEEVILVVWVPVRRE